MEKYASREFAEALKVVLSNIRNCEKMQPKFMEGTSQHTLLKNRIKALNISKALITNENGNENYSKEELIEALRPVSSIISKCEKAQQRFDEGTPQYIRFENLIRAMGISKSLITDEISRTDNLEQSRCMEFSRSIIEGVEIKLCRNDAYLFKQHVHNELSLGYIIEGSTDLTLNDKIIYFSSGDGVVIPPLMTHRCAPNDINHWAYIMLFVDPSYYGDFVSYNQAKRLTGEPLQKLKDFIDQLLSETSRDALESILIELLVEYGEKGNDEPAADNSGDVAKTIHDFIISHIKEDISLDKLQEISGLNKFSIIRGFKKQYVTTPAAYHLQCRIAEAKMLLSKGAAVFDVCAELGFYDQAHLIREFKKMYGVTPGAYIEQLKG